MRPFEGIRVLDLTHVLAGPFCTQQLGILGAEVIKIEAPDNPDMMRFEGVVPEQNEALYGTYFQAQNAGKRSVTLDLKSEAGKEVMARLIRSADVLVQNYAGDALERLGFGADAAQAINPRLIYCTLTGFGRTGEKQDHGAYDIVVQAFAGVMASNHVDAEGPVRVGPPMVDYGTGAQAAYAVSAALFQRERTGKGQRIDVSMTDCAMMLMSVMVTNTLASGASPVPKGNAHPAYAAYRTYATADGILMIGAFTNEQLARVMEVLGETVRAAEVRDTPRDQIGEAVERDSAMIREHMLARPAQEWERLLNDARVPAARIRRLAESLAEEQVRGRGAIAEVMPDDGSDPLSLPVAGFAFQSDGPALSGAPPRLGADTESVLTALGYSDAEIGEFRRAGAL